MAAPGELTRAYRQAGRLAKQAAGNFHLAFTLLPIDQRRGIEALYAFCRAGDDAVDGAGRDSLGRLEQLRRGLNLCYRGRYCDELTLALADSIRRFGFERRWFDELMAGMEADLTVHRYPDFRALRQYCFQAASTVGMLCLAVFRCDSPQARVYAENLGIAMQLTNILRDLAEDYQRGRVYIPLEDLARFGLRDDDFLEPSHWGQLQALVRFEASRAEEYFAGADAVYPADAPPALRVARVMGETYHTLLERVNRRTDPFVRVGLSASEKSAIALRILATA